MVVIKTDVMTGCDTRLGFAVTVGPVFSVGLEAGFPSFSGHQVVVPMMVRVATAPMEQPSECKAQEVMLWSSIVVKVDV